jgi:hypothetical protein
LGAEVHVVKEKNILRPVIHEYFSIELFLISIGKISDGGRQRTVIFPVHIEHKNTAGRYWIRIGCSSIGYLATKRWKWFYVISF